MRAFWGADSMHMIPQSSLHMPVELYTPHLHIAANFEKQLMRKAGDVRMFAQYV